VYFPEPDLPQKEKGEDNTKYLKRMRESIYGTLDAVYVAGCEGLGMVLLEPGDFL
jgi:hypothetical protein